MRSGSRIENSAIMVNCGTSRMAMGPGSNSRFSWLFDGAMADPLWQVWTQPWPKRAHRVKTCRYRRKGSLGCSALSRPAAVTNWRLDVGDHRIRRAQDPNHGAFGA